MSEEDGPLHPYVEWLFGVDPILAAGNGDHRGDARLGDITPDAIAGQHAGRARWLAEAQAQPEPPYGTVDRLEHQVLLTELRAATRRDEAERVSERVPYWYTERLGDALIGLMTDPADNVRAEALAARLRALPDYLAQARRNLTVDTPRLWAEMGATGARGLRRLVGRSIGHYASGLPEALAANVTRAASEAAGAVDAFARFGDELIEQARGEWVCGVEQFNFLLRTYHHLDLDAGELAEHGRALVGRTRAQLQQLAAARDRDASWQQQIDEIKNRRPQPEEFSMPTVTRCGGRGTTRCEPDWRACPTVRAASSSGCPSTGATGCRWASCHRARRTHPACAARS